MSESSTLLAREPRIVEDDDSTRTLDRPRFLRKTLLLLSTATLFWTLVVLGILNLWIGWAVSVLWTLLFTALTTYIFLVLHGLCIWKRGDLPLDRNRRDPTATYIQTDEGRTIEYYVWGSSSPDAIVTVVLHGSSTTGKYFNQFLFPKDAMRSMNVKVISPSFPGHGGSDTQPFRRIRDWPLTDLVPILEKENVFTFIVQGTSYGTSHVMATASILKNRCLAMGLVVPYLPESVCREFDFHTDADKVLKESQFHQPAIILPILSLLSLGQGILGSAISAYPESSKAMEDVPEFFVAISRDLSRAFLRGVWGQAFELLDASIAQHWPDPRTIETPVVSVWYAKDDSRVPPPHEKWLAEHFNQKLGTKTHIRAEKKGLGHFTYFGDENRDTGMQTKELLGLLQTPQ
jgi:pimeloyl-ACP methyl ester carboxylesterase